MNPRFFALLGIVGKFIATKIRTNPMVTGAVGTGAGIIIEKQLDDDDDTKEAIDVLLGDIGTDDREKILTLANGLVGESGNVWVDERIRTGDLTAEWLIVPIGANALASGKTPGVWNKVYGESSLKKSFNRGFNKAKQMYAYKRRTNK